MRVIKRMSILLLLSIAPTIFAQTNCPAIVSAALQAVDTACMATERNQACYGNIVLEAIPRVGTPNFNFKQPGDIVSLSAIEGLKLSSLSLADEIWGVALLRVQANLPDTLPGQNVTFLLFGDVKLTDASSQVVERSLIATSGVNVRLRPTANANNVIASLKSGQEATGTGRLSDSSWIRIRIDDGSEGWVFADFLKGELHQLLTVEPGTLAYGPMQAFYFITGLNDAPCEDAPDSGILIQTPEGAGKIRLRANEVDIQLGSTIYLQAAPDSAMSISVIEGYAIVTAQGQSQIVPSGTVSTIPLDRSGLASGPPTYPQPYVFNRLRYLPLNSAVFVPTEIEHATVHANIQVAIDELQSSNSNNSVNNTATDTSVPSGIQNPDQPASGRWVMLHATRENTCDPSKIPVGNVARSTPLFTFSPDHANFILDWGSGQTQTYVLSGGTTYVWHANPQATETITFTTPTTFVGEHLGLYNDCTYIDDLSGSYMG